MDGTLKEIARAVFPGEDWAGARHVDHGEFHDVLVLPDVAVVRIARSTEEGCRMANRMHLLHRVNGSFPFRVPVPLTDVQWHHGRAAVAQQYLSGGVHPSGPADPGQLRILVEALQSIDVSSVRQFLNEPFAYAGPWESDKQGALFAGTPPAVHAHLHRRLDPLLSMDQAAPSLVHGDLAGYNIHWLNGRLHGVLDWDLASLWDPAINVAYLSMWHGADIAAKITDARTASRARIWRDSLILESISRAISEGRSERVQALVAKVLAQQ